MLHPSNWRRLPNHATLTNCVAPRCSLLKRSVPLPPNRQRNTPHPQKSLIPHRFDQTPPCLELEGPSPYEAAFLLFPPRLGALAADRDSAILGVADSDASVSASDSPCGLHPIMALNARYSSSVSSSISVTDSENCCFTRAQTIPDLDFRAASSMSSSAVSSSRGLPSALSVASFERSKPDHRQHAVPRPSKVCPRFAPRHAGHELYGRIQPGPRVGRLAGCSSRPSTIPGSTARFGASSPSSSHGVEINLRSEYTLWNAIRGSPCSFRPTVTTPPRSVVVV